MCRVSLAGCVTSLSSRIPLPINKLWGSNVPSLLSTIAVIPLISAASSEEPPGAGRNNGVSGGGWANVDVAAADCSSPGLPTVYACSSFPVDCGTTSPSSKLASDCLDDTDAGDADLDEQLDEAALAACVCWCAKADHGLLESALPNNSFCRNEASFSSSILPRNSAATKCTVLSTQRKNSARFTTGTCGSIVPATAASSMACHVSSVEPRPWAKVQSSLRSSTRRSSPCASRPARWN
mmetsp:Transcript_98373/g.195028  ORF Transcript_98373/g.195028 Transcript_98373/m.195028 type:complete len:238 (-) Transcript_98373:284-997(-)